MKITILGPDEKLVWRKVTEPTHDAALATSNIHDATEAEVTVAINGVVSKYPTYEPIEVSEEVVELLENIGYELERM